jgi:hypothetical protein
MSHCHKTNDHREEGALFTNHDDRSSNAKGQSDPSTKTRVLALHGKASNGEVTKLQLANLGITEQHYHIVFLDGPIVEEDADAEVTDFVAGPFYSWFYGDYSDARYKESFFNALLHVFKAIQKLGILMSFTVSQKAPLLQILQAFFLQTPNFIEQIRIPG